MIRAVIAEDDPMVANINTRYVNMFTNITVQAVFTNGKEAWEYIERNEPDLLILDVYMPGLSGMEMLHRIRSKNMSTEVIMVTAANEIASVDKAIKLGIVDYLIKPFEFGRFSQAVTKFLQRKDLLETEHIVDQETIDHLMQNTMPGCQSEVVLRKGLNGKTALYIAGYLEEHPEQMHTCESLSKRLGLSKVTVRRYLNYFIEIGSAVSAIDYETGGRPSLQYMFKSPQSG